MIGETITVLRLPVTPTGEDAQGNPINERELITVDGCAIAWGGSGDDVATSGVRAITAGTVYAQPGTVFQPTDILVIRGTEYVVDGEAGRWTSPFTGVEWGVEVVFKRGS